MKPQTFLPPAATQLEVSIALKEIPSSQPEKEIVKIYIVGSLRSITRIIQSLHRLGFAQVADWCKPQATAKVGEYVSVLIRQLIFKPKG